MLIHLRPRLYGPLGRYTAELRRFEVPAIGVRLSHEDLAANRPYPNKCYTVGCRRAARRAEDGLIFETSAVLERLSSVAEWQVSMAGKSWTLVHQVNYVVLDRECDALTDDMSLWIAVIGWTNRWPDIVMGPPSSAAPRAEIFATGTHVGDVRFTLHPEGADVVPGAIATQIHNFYLPTVERGRLGTAGMFAGRFPREAAA